MSGATFRSICEIILLILSKKKFDYSSKYRQNSCQVSLLIVATIVMNSGFRQFKILNCLKCQQFKGHNSGNCRLVGLLQPVAISPICVFKLKVEARQVIKDQSNHMSASRQERIVCAFNIYKSPHQQFYHPRTFMGQLLWRNNKKDCSVFTVQIHGGQ